VRGTKHPPNLLHDRWWKTYGVVPGTARGCFGNFDDRRDDEYYYYKHYRFFNLFFGPHDTTLCYTTFVRFVADLPTNFFVNYQHLKVLSGPSCVIDRSDHVIVTTVILTPTYISTQADFNRKIFQFADKDSFSRDNFSSQVFQSWAAC
jgi:hypothetical protein